MVNHFVHLEVKVKCRLEQSEAQLQVQNERFFFCCFLFPGYCYIRANKILKRITRKHFHMIDIILIIFIL